MVDGWLMWSQICMWSLITIIYILIDKALGNFWKSDKNKDNSNNIAWEHFPGPIITQS